MESQNPTRQAAPAEEPTSRPRLGLEPGIDEYAKWSHQALGGLLEISNLVGSDLSLDAIMARIVRLTAESMGTPECVIPRDTMYPLTRAYRREQSHHGGLRGLAMGFRLGRRGEGRAGP